DILIHVTLYVTRRISQPACGIAVYNSHGVLMTCVNTVELGSALPSFPEGELNLTIRLEKAAFLPGSYTASFWAMNPQCHIFAMAEQAIHFEIGQTPLYGTCQIDSRWGCVYTNVHFSLEDIPIVSARAL